MRAYTLHHADGRVSAVEGIYTDETIVELALKVNEDWPTNPVVKIVNDDGQTSAGGVIWVAPRA